MKKILQTVCLFVSALVLCTACNCKNSVSDLRRRERTLREKQSEEVDPDFTLDPDEESTLYSR